MNRDRSMQRMGMQRLTALLSISIAVLTAAVSFAQDTRAQETRPGASVHADGPQYLALERRTPQQMSADDATLLRRRGEDLVRAAQFYNIDLQQGSWGYQQSVCPLLPKHLILNYVRIESTGAATQFAAVVPRGNEPVRVVPVQRNGLAPFSPAETSANSVILFNRVWSSEGGDIKTIEAQSNWVTLALCYAEMVGSHPLIVTAKPLVERNAGPPTLRFESDGGASALFADIGLPTQTWAWTLEFDRRGNLKQVQREKLTQPLLPPPPNATLMTKTTPPQTPAEPGVAEPIQAVPVPASQPIPTASVAIAPAASQTVSSAAVAIPLATTATGIPMTRVLPDTEATPGRIIRILPEGQAPPGRIIPGPQELPPPPPK